MSYYKGSSNLVIDKESNYYPFGLEHTGYNGLLGNQSYKYTFQGQERQDETGWLSFKWRNYLPDMGRFFNIDPLSEKYAYQSHYNFSENRVVNARELEGLEAIPADNFKKSDQMLVISAIGRADGIYGDGIKDGKTLYSNLPSHLKNDDGLAFIGSKYQVNGRVITYAGSDTGITAHHIAQTIVNYRSVNPEGKVALIGHSLGGKDVLVASNLLSNNSEVNNQVNLVMALEAASIDGRGSAFSLKLNGNAQNIININSYNSSMKNGGGLTTNSFQNSTTINLPQGTDHTNMDNSFAPYIAPILNYMNKGMNPVDLINNINFNGMRILNNGDLDPNKKKGTSGS
ncbi:RHS repeat-associated core domain-containing protein [Riemerella anatipestifer]|uniref:RHS repeat-associated core domain-containing protein n=1 Tax=Riemerella anatipestifer TaxID=34085 RepID=UPI001FCB6F15|nr:RHS repeat-associated core domain-containing protein [Riemerella anatipestifer]